MMPAFNSRWSLLAALLLGASFTMTACQRQAPPPPPPAPPSTTTTAPVPTPPPPPPAPPVRADLNAETYGNFHTLGVIVRLPADLDHQSLGGAQLFEVRPSGDRRLLDPVWIDSVQAYVCSVFDRQPNTSTALRAVVVDAAGKAVAQREFTGQTRAEPGPPPPARVEIHVAPAGDDAAPGTEAQPMRTVEAALARAELPGTHVVLHDGTYYEGDLYAPPRRGKEGAPLVIKAAPGATPILDGSDPAFFQQGWTPRGGGYFSRPFEGTTSLVAFRNKRTGETFRCYPVETIEQLRGRHCGELGGELRELLAPRHLTNTAFEAFNITGAYHCSGTTMTLWCPAFTPGGDVEIRVSIRGNGIEHGRASFVTYEGLSFQFMSGRAIMVQNSDDVIIRNCKFAYCNVPIGCKGDSNRLLVENCDFRDDCTRWSLLPKMSEGFGYSAYIETGAVNCFPPYNGRGLVVRNNRIEGLFDGALLVPYMTRPTVATSETDFYHNRIVRVLDDFMELDGFPRNVRVFENHMERSLTGVSIAQGSDGPTYIVRNVLGRHGDTSVREVFGRSGYPVKTNGGDTDTDYTGWAFFYQNSCWTEEPETPAFRVKIARWKHLVMANNIWYGTHMGWETYYTAPISPVSLDHDIVWHESGPLFHRDQGSPKDFQTVADVAASGLADIQFLTNAIVADPLYVAAKTGDYQLRPGSPAIDAGAIIPGINDERFAGSAPDIGAIESGMPSPLP